MKPQFLGGKRNGQQFARYDAKAVVDIIKQKEDNKRNKSRRVGKTRSFITGTFGNFFSVREHELTVKKMLNG